mmetsp:Transcript_17256/g.38995  ORF Transcript_17256/g.38995 Transcript_17256/m.38995 type:complete len:435 (-) Transcript_17256:152-1456(-)
MGVHPLRLVSGANAVRRVQPEGRDLVLLRNLLEVAGVGGVVSADHQDEIHTLRGALRPHQVVHGVLARLRRVANRVHQHKVVPKLSRAILCEHGLFEELANLHGLPLEHRRLVGNAQRAQHGVRVKPLRNGVLELVQEVLPVPAVEDVVGHVLRLRQVLHDHISPSKGGRGDGLLVGILAVDDAGVAPAGVRLHRVPHFGDVGARRVHDLHLLVVQDLHLLHRGPKGRQDRDVPLVHLGEILPAVLLAAVLDELDVHLLQALVDARVVNDLVGDVQLAARVRAARLVGHLHRPLHPPAEAVGLGQADGHVADLAAEAVVAHLRDDAGGGVPHAVLLHEVLAFLVVGGLAHVAARLVQRAAEGARVELALALLLRRRGRRLRLRPAGHRPAALAAALLAPARHALAQRALTHARRPHDSVRPQAALATLSTNTGD